MANMLSKTTAVVLRVSRDAIGGNLRHLRPLLPGFSRHLEQRQPLTFGNYRQGILGCCRHRGADTERARRRTIDHLPAEPWLLTLKTTTAPSCPPTFLPAIHPLAVERCSTHGVEIIPRKNIPTIAQMGPA